MPQASVVKLDKMTGLKFWNLWFKNAVVWITVNLLRFDLRQFYLLSKVFNFIVRIKNSAKNFSKNHAMEKLDNFVLHFFFSDTTI